MLKLEHVRAGMRVVDGEGREGMIVTLDYILKGAEIKTLEDNNRVIIPNLVYCPRDHRDLHYIAIKQDSTYYSQDPQFIYALLEHVNVVRTYLNETQKSKIEQYINKLNSIGNE